MPGNETTLKLKADISDLKASMQEAKRQMALTNSEFKAAVAGMGDWSKSADGLSAKLKQLNQNQIQQKSILKDLEAQYEAVAKAEGEDSKGAQDLAIKINQEKAAIGKTDAAIERYENELESLGKETTQASKKTSNLSKQLGALAKATAKGIGKGMVKGVKSLAVGTTALATASVAAGKKIYDMSKQTTEYGDSVDKMSQKVGMSAEAYQKWDYILNISGTEMANMRVGLKTMTNQLGQAQKGSEEAQANFKKLGLSLSDVNNMSREEVFSAVVKGFQGMKDSTERAALANKMFGKSGQELAPLFNTSKEQTKALAKEAEKYGMVMSDKSVKAAAAYKDSLTKLQNTFEGVKRGVVSSMLPALKNITDGLADLMAGSKKADKELSKGFDGIIKKLAKSIPKLATFVSSLAVSVMQSAPEVLTALADGIIKSIPTLQPAFSELISKSASMLTELLPQFTTIGFDIVTDIISGMAEGGESFIAKGTELITSIVAIIGEKAPELMQAGIQLLGALAQGISENAPKLLPEIVSLIMSIGQMLLEQLPALTQIAVQLFMALVDALPTIIVQITDALPGLIEAISTALLDSIDVILNAGIQLFMALIEGLPTVLEQISKNLPQIIDTIVTFLTNSLDKITDAGITLLLALIDALPTVLPQLVAMMPTIAIALAKGLIKSAPKILDAGKKMFLKIKDAIPKAWEKIKKGVGNLVSNIVGTLGKLGTEVFNIGKNLVTGLWNGIKDMTNWVYDKIKGFGEGVVNTLKDFFGIASPSKLMAEKVGKWLPKGIVVGVEKEENNTLKSIKKSAQKIVSAYTDTFSESLANSGKSLVNTASMVAQSVAKTMIEGAKQFNFSGETAVSAYTDEVTKRASYLVDRMTTENKNKIESLKKLASDSEKEWKTKQANIKNARKSDIEDVQKKETKAVKKLEKERDKEIKAVEAKRAKAEKAAEKAKLSQDIASIKKDYDKKISAEKSGAAKEEKEKQKKTENAKQKSAKQVAKLEEEKNKKIKAVQEKIAQVDSKGEKDKYQEEIDAINKSYDRKIKKRKQKSNEEITLIKKESNRKKKVLNATYKARIKQEQGEAEAYEKASEKMMESFNAAMQSYQTQAEALINNTINGVADNFEDQYNKLVSKQADLVSKLKSIGDLYDISDAGVLRIGDIKAQTQQIKDYASQLKEIKGKVSSELFDEIANKDMKEGSLFIKQLLALPESELKAYSDAFTEKMNVSEALAEEMYKEDFDKVGNAYEEALKDAFADLPTQLETLGQDVMQGFVDGMMESTDYVKGQVKTFVDEMVNSFKADLGIASPSKVMRDKIGKFIPQGVAAGIKENISAVAGAMSMLKDMVTDRIDVNIGNINGKSGAVSGSSSVRNDYTFNQYNSSPKPLNRLEIYRQTKNQLNFAKGVI